MFSDIVKDLTINGYNREQVIYSFLVYLYGVGGSLYSKGNMVPSAWGELMRNNVNFVRTSNLEGSLGVLYFQTYTEECRMIHSEAKNI